MQNLNRFLKIVSMSPYKLEDEVASKRMLSGMGRGHVDMHARKTTQKSSLHRPPVAVSAQRVADYAEMHIRCMLINPYNTTMYRPQQVIF